MKKEHITGFKTLKTILSSGIIGLGLFLLPCVARAENPHPELAVYEKILTQRQSISCLGNITTFDIEAFLTADVNGDNVYELIVADKNLCNNSSKGEHTHVTLYKYRMGAAEIVNGIFTKKGGENTVYISKTYDRIMVQTYIKEWLTLNMYGAPITYTKKPSADYKEYTLYKNTAKNRKKYLRENPENSKISNKYEKKLTAITKEQKKLENTMNKNGKKAFKQVSSAYDSLKKKPLNQLSRDIKTALASKLPASAENALVKVFTDTIQEKLIVKPSSYKDCKTAAQLVNKVAAQISNEEGTFTFRSKGVTYTATFQSIGIAGASYISGSVRGSNGRTYPFGGTLTSKQNIKEELNQLKKFSDQKMEEAKKEVLSASGDLLAPKALRKYLKTASKSQLYKVVNKKSPAAAKLIKKGIDTADKFSAVEKAYKGLLSLDLQNTPEDKLIKQISQYHKKVAAFEKSIDALF